MVPIQTVLALLTLLVMLSSCTQKAPPGTVGAGQGVSESARNHVLKSPNGIIKPPSLNTTPTPGPAPDAGSKITPNQTKVPMAVGSSLMFLYQQKEKITLTLKGEDAKKIYLMTGIRPDETGEKKTLVKHGSQYSCANEGGSFICYFEIVLPLGTVNLQLDKVQSSVPELAQIAAEDFYLRIESDTDSQPGEVVLKLPRDYSETVYSQLKLPHQQTFKLLKTETWGEGTHWIAKSVNCYQRVHAPSENEPNPKPYFECFLHLNTNLGTVMDVSPDTIN